MQKTILKMVPLVLMIGIIGCNHFKIGNEAKWIVIADDSTGKTSVVLDSIREVHRYGWLDAPLSPPQVVNDYGDTAVNLQTQIIINCDEKLIARRLYLYKNKNDTVIFRQPMFPLQAVDISRGTIEEKIMLTICKQ